MLKAKIIIGIVLVTAILSGAGYGVWYLQRTVHYKLSYESMVEQTIREMVKKEALRESN